MKLEEMRRLASLKSKGIWEMEESYGGRVVTTPSHWICEGLNYEGGRENAEFISMASNKFDKIMAVLEAADDLTANCRDIMTIDGYIDRIGVALGNLEAE